MQKVELYNNHFQNWKQYGIPKAQLIIADIPYNLGNWAYASNPAWYKDGDNKNGESEKAGKEFLNTAKIGLIWFIKLILFLPMVLIIFPCHWIFPKYMEFIDYLNNKENSLRK